MQEVASVDLSLADARLEDQRVVAPVGGGDLVDLAEVVERVVGPAQNGGYEVAPAVRRERHRTEELDVGRQQSGDGVVILGFDGCAE